MATFWQEPIVIGLVIAIPSAALGLLGYLRSRRVDQVAEQAGIATSRATSIGQVVDGLNTVITALQNDNKVLREALAGVQEGNKVLEAELTRVETEVRALEVEVKALNTIINSKES